MLLSNVLLQNQSDWYFHFSWTPIIIGLIIILVLAIFFVTPFLISCVAENKGRSGVGWFFLSLLIGPFFAILVLIALGDTDEKRNEKAINDEMARISVRYGLDNSNYSNSDLKILLDQSRKK